MSIQAMVWVLDNSPTVGTERLVLLSLANHAHADGTHAFPTVSTVAREARCSKRSAQYALTALETGGAISREGVGPNGATNWRVNMTAIAAAYKVAEHVLTTRRKTRGEARGEGGATVAPPSSGATSGSPGAQQLRSGGATSPRAGLSRQEPSGLTPRSPSARRLREAAAAGAPQPPQAGELPARPQRPTGQRRRDTARYEEALAEWLAKAAAWAPCPGDDLDDEVFAHSWEAIMLELRKQTTIDAYALYLADLHPHALADDGTLILGADGRISGWLASRYGRLIVEAAQHFGVGVSGLDVLPCAHVPNLNPPPLEDGDQDGCLSPDHDQRNPHQEGATE